jgi:hypothetical protein
VSGVEVTVLNERTMRDMLSDMRLRARDLTPVWVRFGDNVARHIGETFATQGASVGNPWAPLTPAYAAWKLARVGPRPVLVLFGNLIKGLTGRPLDVERYAPHWAEYGSTDPTLGFHQFGTRFMPARPPLDVTASLNEELARLTVDHIVGDDG